MWIDEENISTTYQEIKKFCRQNNPQSLKSTFTSRFVCGLKGKDGFQSLSFKLKKIFASMCRIT